MPRIYLTIATKLSRFEVSFNASPPHLGPSMSNITAIIMPIYRWLNHEPKADSTFDLRLKKLGCVHQTRITKTFVFKKLPEPLAI